MDAPAVFELEIQSFGATRTPVRDVNVVLDFGRAEIEVCGHVPVSVVSNVASEGKSIRRLKISELGLIVCYVGESTKNITPAFCRPLEANDRREVAESGSAARHC